MCPRSAPSASLCSLHPAGEKRQVCAQILSPSGSRMWPWPELTSAPGLQNQFRHGFKITKSDFALTVTGIYRFFAVCCNTGCHSLSLAFFDVVLPNVSKLYRLCKLTDPSAQNCSFQRTPPSTERQNLFQS